MEEAMFYIAVKNLKTGKFEITWENGSPKSYSEEKAVEALETYVQNIGKLNVMLLKIVFPKIETKITMPKK